MAFRGSADGTSATALCVVNVAGIGIQNGDIVLLCAIGNPPATPAFPVGFNTPTGLSNGSVAGDSSGTTSIAWKVASGEPTSYTVTGFNASGNAAVQCRVYSGRAASQFTATSQTATSANFNYPGAFSLTGLTAAAQDDVCAFVCVSGIGSTGHTYSLSVVPTGFANTDFTQNNNAFPYFPYIVGIDDVNVSAGATGAIAGTLADTGSGINQQYMGYVLSLAAPASSLLMGQQCL